MPADRLSQAGPPQGCLGAVEVRLWFDVGPRIRPKDLGNCLSRPLCPCLELALAQYMVMRSAELGSAQTIVVSQKCP